MSVFQSIVIIVIPFEQEKSVEKTIKVQAEKKHIPKQSTEPVIDLEKQALVIDLEKQQHASSNNNNNDTDVKHNKDE
jgi:hypothetical protein